MITKLSRSTVLFCCSRKKTKSEYWRATEDSSQILLHNPVHFVMGFSLTNSKEKMADSSHPQKKFEGKWTLRLQKGKLGISVAIGLIVVRRERAQKEAPKAEVESSGHCEPAPTSTSSTGCPLWLSCGWNSTESLPTFILVTHSIRSRSIGG